MQQINLENSVPLGYGVLDMQVGDWLTSNDVAGFTNVRCPYQDNKFHVRELLAILGKRFANAEAEAIWQEIENYRQAIAATFGPPTAPRELLDFAQAAHSWYAAYGPQFEKNWYLQATSFDLTFARSQGRENIKGRWIHWIHPDFAFFVQAGFSPWTLLAAIHTSQFGGWLKTLDLLRFNNRERVRLFWVRLTAYLMGFDLNVAQVRGAVAEVAAHTVRLQEQYKRPVGTPEAALNYFRRLELGGLGPEVIDF